MDITKPRGIPTYVEGKKIFWLVLTGGPCSGKTTAIAKLEKELTSKGYKVFIVEEVATAQKKAGIGYADVSNWDFQNYIATMQIAKEAIIEDAAIKCKRYDNIVIICDRGLIDGKAYMPDDDFAKLLGTFGINEIKARDSYNAVIHMITAANGAEKYYTLTNNSAREESPEEAREKDINTLQAWVGHPRYQIIDNSTNFPKKIERVKNAVYSFLGVPIPIEVFDKYLVQMPDIEALQKESNFAKIDIVETYLTCNEGESERSIMQRGTGGDYTFYYTERRHYPNYDRIDTERHLSQREYIDMLSQADTRLKQIIKTKYCFEWHDKYYELDVYNFEKDKAILKVQPTAQNRIIEIPNFISTIKEVTNDSAYTDYALAQKN